MEDEEFPESFILLHCIPLDLLEFDLEELQVINHVHLVQFRVVVHFDGDFLKFLKEGVVYRFLVLFLHQS